MAIEEVKVYFKDLGMIDKIQEFSVSSATVELAAEALGVIPARIAKTLSFHGEEGTIMVVAAGDAKVDSRKFKDTFHLKARMLKAEEVLQMTGYPVGGVCPFALPRGVKVYLDRSLKRFGTVFPACGSINSAIELTPSELHRYSLAEEWVDVCKGWLEG